jgi:RNA polymerase sigma-70 factor, ECF subfamily
VVGVVVDEAIHATLTEDFRRGAETALPAAVRLYQHELFLFALRMLRNEADAEETVQEAFLRAHRSRRKFRGDASLKTWLYRITANLCLNRLKKGKREALVEMAEPLPAEPEGLNSLLDEELLQHTRRALEELPPQQKLVLTLRVYQEKSLQEIAAITGSALGTVKANLFHATRNLKKCLAANFPGEIEP